MDKSMLTNLVSEKCPFRSYCVQRVLSNSMKGRKEEGEEGQVQSLAAG